jgi:hypothetical protein
MPRIAFMPILLVAILVARPLLAGEPGVGAQAGRPLRPVHTYSIVARDPKTGEIGVAVQSHWFAIGPIVPWVEAGVGAVATQSFIDPSYGKIGLDLMRVGRSGPDALKGLLAADENREVRQVAMIDSQGRVAAHTGAKCIPMAGQHVGPDYSVQANANRANGIRTADDRRRSNIGSSRVANQTSVTKMQPDHTPVAHASCNEDTVSTEQRHERNYNSPRRP